MALLDRLSAVVLSGHPDHYRLPERIVSAAEAVARLTEESGEARRAQNELRATMRSSPGRAALAMVAAARGGPAVPSPIAEVEAARQAAERALVAARIAGDARRRSEEDLRRLILTSNDEIVTEGLRPALAEVVEVVRDVAPYLEPYNLADVERLLRAPEPVREGYAALHAAHDRYRAIRDCQKALSVIRYGLSRVDLDAELKDPSEAWPGWSAALSLGKRPPWPADPLGRLLYIVAHAELWIPTAAQLDALRGRTPPRIKAAGRRRAVA